MDDKQHIGPRAMNDYTADTNKYTKKPYIEPMKSAICIWSNSANENLPKRKK